MGETSTSILGVAVRDINRLRSVTTTVALHGFGELVMRSPLGRLLYKDSEPAEVSEELKQAPAAMRFKRLLEALGPTYIKLGQILSMRPDRLPADYIEALQTLQDDTETLPFEAIRAVVEEGLGKPIEEIFESFDEKPLGTASIAQTHLAITKEGQQVVVKVQRPGIGEVMKSDLDLLYLGARILEATIEEMDLYSPSEVMLEFEKALVQELNFSFELSNLITARQLLDPERSVCVPEPFQSLSCRTVLTMEFFEGKPLRKLEARSAEARHAVEEILHLGLKNTFVDGFYHGDPHSGNILVNDEGMVCMIDWGQVGRLNTAQREDLVTLIIAAITNDVDTLARILIKMGRPTQRINMAEFKEDIRRIRTEQLQVSNLEEYDSGQFVQEFVVAAQRFRIKLNSNYSVLTKAAATIEGIVAELHPDVDIIGIARLYTEPIIRSRFTPQKLVEEAMSGVGGMGSMLRHLPNQLDQVLHDLETGNVQVRALTPGLVEVAPTLHQVGSRLCMALFAAAMSICTALLLPQDPTTVWGVPLLSVFCLIMAVVCWTVLWWWHWIGTGRPVKVTPLIKLFKRG